MESNARSTSYSDKLDPAELAFLRAVAEGLGVNDAAARYLKGHGNGGGTRSSRQVIERARNQARRHGESAWRLIGWQGASGTTTSLPTLEDFALHHGLEGWSESELQAWHIEAHRTSDRHQTRRARLRERQLDLLRRLERYALQPAQRADPVSHWFDPATAERCAVAGLHTLADLEMRIERGSTWWHELPAIGVGKARRIAERLHSLCPTASPGPGMPATIDPENSPAIQTGRDPMLRLGGGAGPSVAAPSPFGDSAVAAVDAWIAQRARSAHTARAYRRAALAWCHWLAVTAAVPLAEATEAHARAYLMHRQDAERASDRVAGRQRAAPLSMASLKQERNVLHGFTRWLLEEGHLGCGNCWRHVAVAGAATESAQTGAAEGDGVHAAAGVEPFNSKTEVAREARRSVGWRTPPTGEPGPPAHPKEAVTTAPPAAALRRAVLVSRVIALTGLRLSELLPCRVGDLVWTAGAGDPFVVHLRLVDRVANGTAGSMQLDQAMIELLAELLGIPGRMESFRELPAGQPLIGRLNDPMRPLTPGGLRTASLRVLRSGDGDEGSARPRMSWLGLRGRSLEGPGQLSGETLALWQQRLGHRDIRSTLATLGFDSAGRLHVR